MVMYHGTPNGDFTTFRSGSYFTPNKEYADVYQSQGASSLGYKKTANKPDTYEVYLNIKKPFDTRNPKERRIFEEEYYGQWGMGTPLMDSGLPDWLDGEDLQEFLEENGYEYDGLILDEGGVGGYGDEVISRGLSYVVFNPEQVKRVDNTKPTEDPDIRFSLSNSKEAPLENRVSGDELLNAQDTLEIIKDVGGSVDNNGYVTLYHRTIKEKAKQIIDTKRMSAKEDGIFFSTSESGYNYGYGDSVLEFKVPVEKIVLDDIFGD